MVSKTLRSLALKAGSITMAASRSISVDTNKHVVTLKGTVMGRAGRAKATTIAMRTEGVRRVVNRLTIGPKRTN